MEIDQLRYFLNVVRQGSFSRAAEDLGISQSALSRSILRLEEELGMPVLVRKTKSLDLTDAGFLLQSRAEQILAILEDTKSEICDDGEHGRIRVGVIPTIAPYFLPKFLQKYAQDFPQASVVIHEQTTDQLLKSCSQGEIDLAILVLPINAKYLETEHLFEEEIYLVTSTEHRLAKQKSVRLDEIEQEPFVMLDEAHCLSENILSFCRQRSFQPVVVGRTNQLATVQELVSLSHGISMIPQMAKENDQSNLRVYLSVADEIPKRQLAVAWDPYRYQCKLVTAFREHLKSYCEKLC